MRFRALVFLLALWAQSSTALLQESKGEGLQKGLILGTFQVDAGEFGRTDTPVRYQCRFSEVVSQRVSERLAPRRPGERFPSLLLDHHLVLLEKGSTRETHVQWEPEVRFDWEETTDRGALVWILAGQTSPGSTRKFDLILRGGPAPSGLLSVSDLLEKHLLIKHGMQPVLRYNYGIIKQIEGKTRESGEVDTIYYHHEGGTLASPDGQVGPFDRSSYIHPIWTPAGRIVTGDFSPEHIHQRGVFLAWLKARFGDIRSDFWGLGENTGRVVADERAPQVIEGPVFARLVIYNRGTVQDKTYFKEICSVTVYSLSSDRQWLLDLRFQQVPVDPDRPAVPAQTNLLMELEKSLYGGMAFRGPSGWLFPEQELTILTSEGKDRLNGNQTRARWIDYTGPLGNDWGGIVLFDHPSNPRYPTPLRIHPQLPYFCLSFTQSEAYTLESGRPLDLWYRILVHDRRPDAEEDERFSRDFLKPPNVIWLPSE